MARTRLLLLGSRALCETATVRAPPRRTNASVTRSAPSRVETAVTNATAAEAKRSWPKAEAARSRTVRGRPGRTAARGWGAGGRSAGAAAPRGIEEDTAVSRGRSCALGPDGPTRPQAPDGCGAPR